LIIEKNHGFASVERRRQGQGRKGDLLGGCKLVPKHEGRGESISAFLGKGFDKGPKLGEKCSLGKC